MNLASDIKYIGVNDYDIDLFEGMYAVPNGMAYNSYAIIDEKIAVMDTVDVGFAQQWLSNIRNAIGNREPDYLIVQHMEPDHSANIMSFMQEYRDAVVVASAKAFAMMKNYFGTDFAKQRIEVAEGDVLSLGNHVLHFVTAPMVHWPEVIMTYDSWANVIFSADGFGKFGATDIDEEWVSEARRYYFGIVGKYGLQVQNLLKKLRKLEVKAICPLHGPVLSQNIQYYIELYNKWSCYEPEEDGVVIAYTSVYGNTKAAALMLAEELCKSGTCEVVVYDLARCDVSQAVADAFRFSKLVLATTTYNAEIFPFMREFINSLTERNFCNRTVAFVENGSWAPVAAKVMKEKFAGCKNISFADTTVRILSALNEDSKRQLITLAEELCKE